MYRLKYRLKSVAAIGAFIFGVLVIIAIPYIAATQGLIYDLPVAYFAAGQVLLPFFFALFNYRTCPFIQQMRAFLVTCSIIGFFGILANLAPDMCKFQVIQTDWLLHFNAVTFGVMNLFGLITATNLMQAEQMSSFADTKVAEAQLERLKAVKVDPETQAKWEKAAAYADRSADGRSLRSTMTNLKAISLTEPGQELKPTARESVEKQTAKEKAAPASSGDDGSLANLLDRMDDLPMGDESAQLSAIRRDPALAGNSFINDAADPEPADSGASFLDSLLNAKIAEGDEQALQSSEMPDLDLPAEEPETIDVAALLDSFPEDPTESDAAQAEDEALSSLYEPKPWVSEEKFEAQPISTGQADASVAEEKPETTRTSSFASASSSRNSMPAMQPLNEGASSEITALKGDDTSNFPVPNVAPQGFAPTPPSASPSNTNNKLAAMKRRNTSTFTKLNALSASGSGALKPPPPPADTDEQPDSLRSLLDRLDDEPSEEPTPKVEETARPIEPPVELTIDTVFREDGTPEVASSPQAQAAPAKTAEAAAKTEPKPEPKPEPEPEPVQEIEAAPKLEIEDEPSPLSSLLDRSLGEIDEDEVAAPSADQPEALPEELPETLQESQADSEVQSGAALLEAEPEEEEEVREAVFGQGVDSDIDNIFSELAPPEAQLEVGQTTPAAKTTAAQKPEEIEESSEIDSIFADHAPTAEEASTTGSADLAPGLEALSTEESEAEEPSEAPSSLFDGGLDSEIDNIFSELAPPEAQKEVKDTLPASANKESEKVSAPVTAEVEDFAPEADGESSASAEGGEEGGLFGEDLGQELDNIFSGLTEGPQLEVTPSTLARYKGDEGGAAAKSPAHDAEAVQAVAKAPAPTPDKAASTDSPTPGKAEPSKYKEVKEFGRLSSKPSTVAKFGNDTGGTMKTIGKLLLDVQAVENIIKSGENRKIGSGLSTAKIISAARGEGIKNILNAIDTYEGVAGSLIVGHDGLVIASTVGTGWDKDMLGALSTALLSTSNLATKKLEIGKLRQMVMLTSLDNGDGQYKTTVLTDVDVGILAVFLEKTDLGKIDGLLETIQSTIHGG